MRLFFLAAIVCLAQPRVTLVGDSTVAEGGGWGPGFRAALAGQFEVRNLARNGRSSKSFREEGAWKPAVDGTAKYILIQFGHNDCPGKGPERETDPGTTYRANLKLYVDEARSAGTTPILVTSIVRRNFDGNGKIKADCLVPFVENVRLLAVETKTPLIDLYALTRELSEKIGPEASDELGARTDDGKPDRTHLSAKGQREIGAIAAREFLRVIAR
ncbi:MAG: rhamnogalacturonan acetylesterase [Acidobacteria bacterium]|nr:rhamnogalacturonan acetylesterase [Acidobacteriota bacterium]